MESDVAAAPLGYVNRPTGRVHHEREPIVPDSQVGHRQAMRIALVALRAYEQRAQSRAALRAWLSARAGAGPATAA